jgi:hypothetical protein
MSLEAPPNPALPLYQCDERSDPTIVPEGGFRPFTLPSPLLRQYGFVELYRDTFGLDRIDWSETPDRTW